MRKLKYIFKVKKEKCMGHTFASFFTTPIQPCGNKANTLFSPYVLLKRALFDLKLIGQAWAQGLKAWTAGLSTAAQVVVEVAEESSPLLSSPLFLFHLLMSSPFISSPLLSSPLVSFPLLSPSLLSSPTHLPSSCVHLSIPRVHSIPFHLYPCFAAPIFYLSQPVNFRKLGRVQFRVWQAVYVDVNGC